MEKSALAVLYKNSAFLCDRTNKFCINLSYTNSGILCNWLVTDHKHIVTCNIYFCISLQLNKIWLCKCNGSYCFIIFVTCLMRPWDKKGLHAFIKKYLQLNFKEIAKVQSKWVRDIHTFFTHYVHICVCLKGIGIVRFVLCHLSIEFTHLSKNKCMRRPACFINSIWNCAFLGAHARLANSSDKFSYDVAFITYICLLSFRSNWITRYLKDFKRR